jgi:hypothetical protein
MKTIEAYVPEDLPCCNPAKTMLEKRSFLPQFNAADLSHTRDGVVPNFTMACDIKSLKGR